MQYQNPRLPEKELEYLLGNFSKTEVKARLLKYIEGVFDVARQQAVATYNLEKLTDSIIRDTVSLAESQYTEQLDSIVVQKPGGYV